MSPRIVAALVVAALVLPLSATAGVGGRCHTPEFLAMRGFVTPPGTLRPDAVGYVDSETLPIRVHYRRAEDAQRAAEVILPIAEETWEIEVDQMGWPAPASDGDIGGDGRFDYYLTNEDTWGGAYTYYNGGDAIDGDDWYSLAAYVALDDTEIYDEDMDDFIAHEFNHASQYTIDGNEYTLFVWESTAEAMEELVYPDSNLYYWDIVDFQALPFASLLFDSWMDEIMEYNDWSYYEYGGSIVGLYLEERLGNRDGSKMLELWEHLAQGSMANEPDYVDALDLIGGDELPDHGAVYLDLAAWRLFLGPDDDGAHYVEGADWPNNSVLVAEETLTLEDVDGTTITPVDPPYDLGASYWRIDVGAGSTDTLHLELTSDDEVEWGLVGVAWLDGAPARVVQSRATVGETVVLDLDLTGATAVAIGAASLGPVDMNAEGAHPRRDFALSTDLVPPPEDTGGDTEDTDDTDDQNDTDDEGEKPKACGCDGSGGAAIGGLALAAGVLVVRRRRRSSR